MMQLDIKDISKQYKNKKALDSFSATLTEGVYGLIGPNGAGKSTLLNIIVGILSPTIGKICWNDVELQLLGYKYIEKLGYLPQSPGFYMGYKVYDFLLYISALKGLSKRVAIPVVEEYLNKVNMWNERNKKIGACSGGMRQRLGIASAMIGNPDIIILDEPTAGLDPRERIKFRNLISCLGQNKIVILATHIITDVEYIAKEVILLKSGQKLRQASPELLIEEIQGFVWQVESKTESEVNSLFERFKVSNVNHKKDGYQVRIVSKEKPEEGSIQVTPCLEDVYLYFFGECSS